MNVLVTGGGLIGAYTAAKLLALGHSITVVDAKPDLGYLKAVIASSVDVIQVHLENFEALSNALKGRSLDAVVHTAGVMRNRIEMDPWLGFNANVVGTAAIAEYVRQYGVRKFVFCSSLCVYDFSQTVAEITEEHHKAPQNLYDCTKLITESWLQILFKTGKTQLTILRLAGTYGAGQYRGGAWMGKRLQDLILPLVWGITNKVQLDVTTFGVNEYLYVKDAAHAICLAVEREQTGVEPLICNVGSGKLTSTHELVYALNYLFPHIQVRLTESTQDRPAYLRRTGSLSLNLAHTELKYAPAFSEIQKGLADYIEEVARLKELVKTG